MYTFYNALIIIIKCYESNSSKYVFVFVTSQCIERQTVSLP